MLVLVSDLHLTDGTTAKNVNPEAFALMASLIRDTAIRRGAREIHLVLLGDIFDLVRTDYWLRTGVPPARRPWGGAPDPRTALNTDTAEVERQFAAVLDGILATDSAGELGRAIASLTDAARPLRVSYVLGNHDRVFWNLPGLRARLTAAFPAISSFFSALESPEYGVLARHGHEWDEPNHGWHFREKVLLPSERIGRFDPEAYQVMAIGEVITAELMGGLVHHVRLGGAAPGLVDQVMEVNNLRPILDVFSWLEWMGEGRSDAQQRLLFEALRKALDGVVESRLAQQWDRLQRDILVSADLVDRLQQARSILLGSNFKTFKGRVEAVRKLQGVFTRIFGEGDDRLLEGAASEQAFKPGQESRGIQRIIYGHTHRPTHRYFSGLRDGRVQMYVNTGTYLPLIARTADGRGFASSIQMTLVYVYRADEDLGGKAPGTTSMDIWNGVRRKTYG